MGSIVGSTDLTTLRRPLELARVIGDVDQVTASQVRFMPYSMSVNPQSPTRSLATEPLRRRLHDARDYEVISIPVFICIFAKRGQLHSSLQSHEISICVFARILVRKTKQFAEYSHEVGTDSQRLGFSHWYTVLGRNSTSGP
jgi:hypothetical protein